LILLWYIKVFIIRYELYGLFIFIPVKYFIVYMACNGITIGLEGKKYLTEK